MKKLWTMCLLLMPLVALSAGDEPVNLEMMSRIRMEAFNNSKVMDTLKYLTEEIGPRLTNSPNMTRANDWTRRTLEEWGMDNVHLEEWGPFGRGWSYTHASVHMTTPRQTPLLSLPKAWTPGTDGPVTGKAMVVDIDDEEDFEQYRGKLAGKILFMSEARKYKHKEDSDFHRYSDEDLQDMCNYEISDRDRSSNWRKRYAKRMKFGPKLRAFLKEEGALAMIHISSRDDGIIRVMGGGSYKKDEDPGIPDLIMGAEYYNMVMRMLDNDVEVELTVDVKAQFHDENPMGHNTIAEITGTDLKDEIVMAGAHLDSWHGANGALDNGVGVAVVMEALRILKELDIKPRRTVRIGLWSGEEQGLHGSRAHVKQHYVDRVIDDPKTKKRMENMPSWMKDSMGRIQPKADFNKFSCYFNLDNGGGKIRGIYTENNAAVVPIFKSWLEPFADVGSSTVTMRSTGGTDHMAFDRSGLPGFQFIQDKLTYSPKNHHTNLDVYDHVIPSDLKQASALMAAFMYNAAMRDAKLPRKPLPKPPKPEKEDKTLGM